MADYQKTPLEDQAKKDEKALRGKGKGKASTPADDGNPQGEGGKYGRKKGDSLGGGLKAGGYRKQSVDDTLPSILQKLITKEREAREIIKSQDASRYGELPNLYNDIRGLEAKRDKVIKQVSNPVDDNKDTDYVVKQYDRFLFGKPAHFGVRGKKEKYPFSSGGKEFTEDEVKFAMTRTSVVPGLNKAGLATKQQSRDRFGNALDMPSDFRQGTREAMPKTKKQEEKLKETSPADISARETKAKQRAKENGYKAYKTNEFNDDGSLKKKSANYQRWLDIHADGKDEEDEATAEYQKRYMREDYEKPPASAPPATKTSTESKTKSGGVRGSGRRNPATSSSKRAVGMPNDKSTRKGLIQDTNSDNDAIDILFNDKDANDVGEKIDATRKKETDKTKRDNYDDSLIGAVFTNFGDAKWLADNPPGSPKYEKNKAVLEYYRKIGVEPAYQYPDAPTSSGGEGSSSTDPPAEEKHPTSEGVKGTATDADGDTTQTEQPTPQTEYMSEEQKQEEEDKKFTKTEVKDAPRPGTTEEYEVLDADRGTPSQTPASASGMPLKPSEIAKARGDDIEKENKQRGKASIKRLKEEIRAYHLVYDNNIKEFRENPHKKDKEDALKSDKIEVVRAHHKKMEEKIREYYRSGDADSLNVGVIIPIDTYLQQYLSRSTPQVSNIPPPMPSATTGGSAGATHRHQHLTKKGHDPFGHSIAAGTYYQRGGIQTYKQQPVANHTIRIKGAVGKATIQDPKVYVDAPMNNFLQRPLKLTSTLKIKS